LEIAMRCLVVCAALLGLAGFAEAREPLARPMERTPSIMVGGDEARPSRAERRRAVQSRSTRRQATRARPVVNPRASSAYEFETGSINRSIGAQTQQLQREQSRQVDNSLFRQEIQRSSPGLRCTPGSLGC
jgi:hypothetical protein